MLLASLLLGGCVPDFGVFTVVDDADAGGAADAGAVDGGGTDGGGLDGGGLDGGAVDAGSTDGGPPGDGGTPTCAVRPLPCLDASDPDVIELPTEAGAEAFDTATPGQTIQVRGASLTGLSWIPTGVTLRGCEGARITGAVAFEGGLGFVEGFAVSGQIVANRGGTFTIRDNVFSGSTGREGVVEARAIDALVSANVRATVERNHFADVGDGVVARTRYDTMVHAVELTVRNNVFERVPRPIVLDEAGLVGAISAHIAHNTFVDFATAIRIVDVSMGTVELPANLFARGDTAVAGDSAWEGAANLYWLVTQPHVVPPLAGGLSEIDEPFEDTEGGDLRLVAGSPAVDGVAVGDVADDFFGCPRPAGPRADVGAIETR